ncbi:chaoptin-like [Pararge aegeria]|uniref:chaoptin-like n=1 Tax=Pararge aegeria TaxID=116150 RepID=UPI0019D16480|nr:chaoptin-like [Pararge aegeria]
MLLLILLLLATFMGVKGGCTLTENPRLNGICSADVLCDGTTENAEDLKNSWDCIRTGGRFYNHYSQSYDYELVDNYYLYFYVSDVDINISEDPLSGIDVGTKITTLNINNGNLVSVPIITSSLPTLTELSVTYNKVETVNLRKLSGVSMVALNVSHNCISSIEFDEIENTVSSKITSIDLSYNYLESLPDNCFEMFLYLKYLDLSYNKLKQFDVLTFEGMTKLETLKLSNNEISDIDQNLARFRNLKHLTLDNNQLTSLTNLNFKTLTSLENLNISSNMIKHIDDQSFATLRNIAQLDLSHNKIINIHQSLFKNNIKMNNLSLSQNYIETIEGGAFRNTNISHFDIQNNYMSGSIEYDTFLGISVESLDLSKGYLKELGDKAFSALSKDLRYLNLSSNLIENVTESAFQALEILSTLDLSCNHLIDINLNTSDLHQLSEYYLQNNFIKKITPNMFKNMTRLTTLDLSQNKIDNIELNSFIELVSLLDLNISRNNFVDSLKRNTFRGLYKVRTLDLSHTKSVSCLNESFSGLILLTFLNLSHSQLQTIEYNTFKGSGAIKILDLSHNLLYNFHINTSSISQLSKLYLNQNKLKNITSETFKNFHLLEHLNLAFNNIINIDSGGFRMLSHLHYLDLLSNNNLHIKSDVFNNLILSQLSVSNIQRQFDFENVLNTSVATLILSNCEIEDINSVFVYKINNVLKLDVSSNKIKILDKSSFQNMAALNWLDLSNNMISTIQPGTFLSNNMINTMNLYGNNLQSLKFGVLDGLRNLRVLNLSNNEIHTFGVNLLHTSPFLTELFLENNKLESIDLGAFSKTGVQLLTIGGNSISCDALADWAKISNDEFNVTAESFNFDFENINGIGCKTSYSQKKTHDENNNLNITSNVSEMKETVGRLYSYFSKDVNAIFSKIIALLEKKTEDVDQVPPNFDHSQMVLSTHLEKILNENKDLLPQLVRTNDNVANYIKRMISLLEINNNLTILGNNQKEMLQTPVSSKTIEKHNKNNSVDIGGEPLEVKFDRNTLIDIKTLLYIIAVCLAITVLFCIIAISYKYLYRGATHRIRSNYLYDSGQSVRNGLEME